MQLERPSLRRRGDSLARGGAGGGREVHGSARHDISSRRRPLPVTDRRLISDRPATARPPLQSPHCHCSSILSGAGRPGRAPLAPASSVSEVLVAGAGAEKPPPPTTCCLFVGPRRCDAQFVVFVSGISAVHPGRFRVLRACELSKTRSWFSTTVYRVNDLRVGQRFSSSVR